MLTRSPVQCTHAHTHTHTLSLPTRKRRYNSFHFAKFVFKGEAEWGVDKELNGIRDSTLTS